MRLLTGLLLATLISVPAFAQKSASARIMAATEDLKEMMNASDKGIPQDLLNRATCLIIIPNLKAGGFIVGGQYGKGFFTCRKESGVGWHAPGSVKLTGGKFGFLVGGKETDVIMLVMNKVRNESPVERQIPNWRRSVGGGWSGRPGFVSHDGRRNARRDSFLLAVARHVRRHRY